jgi:hypothetical protein
MASWNKRCSCEIAVSFSLYIANLVKANSYPIPVVITPSRLEAHMTKKRKKSKPVIDNKLDEDK